MRNYQESVTTGQTDTWTEGWIDRHWQTDRCRTKLSLSAAMLRRWPNNRLQWVCIILYRDPTKQPTQVQVFTVSNIWANLYHSGEALKYRILVFWSARKTQNIEYLLSVKFHQMPFNGYRGEPWEPGWPSLFFFLSAWKHKIGKECWDLASCQVTSNSIQQL